jgi:hypothetical protein
MPMPKKLVWKFVYFFIELLRFIFPMFIFSFPALTVFVAIFLDAVDGEFASQEVLSHEKYQIVDKLMDNWFDLWALAYSYFAFNDFFIFLLILIVFRFIGLAVFLKFGRRGALVIFPNFFENAFLLFFFVSLFNLGFLITGVNLYYSLTAVFVFKILQEYWLHILKKSLVEDVFKFGWRKW